MDPNNYQIKIQKLQATLVANTIKQFKEFESNLDFNLSSNSYPILTASLKSLTGKEQKPANSNGQRIVLKTTLDSTNHHDNKLLDQVNSLINSYRDSNSPDKQEYKDYVDLTNYINSHHLYSLDSNDKGSSLLKYNQSILTRMELNKYQHRDVPISELLILKPELTGIERELKLFKVNGSYLLCDPFTGNFFRLETNQTPYKLELITEDLPVKIQDKRFIPRLINSALALEEVKQLASTEVINELNTQQFTNISAPHRYKLLEDKLIGRGLRLIDNTIIVDIPRDFNSDEKALLLGRLSLWYDKIQQVNNVLRGEYDDLTEYQLSDKDKTIMTALIDSGYKGLDSIIEVNNFILNPEKLDLDKVENILIRKFGWSQEVVKRQRAVSDTRLSIVSLAYQIVRSVEFAIDSKGIILELAESLEKVEIKIGIQESTGLFTFEGNKILSSLTDEQKNFISGRLTLSLLESAEKINPNLDLNSEYKFEKGNSHFIKSLIQITGSKGSDEKLDLFSLIEEIEKVTYPNLIKSLVSRGWNSNLDNDNGGVASISLMLVSLAESIENEMFNIENSTPIDVLPPSDSFVDDSEDIQIDTVLSVDTNEISLDLLTIPESIEITKDNLKIANLFCSIDKESDGSVTLKFALIDIIENEEEEFGVNMLPLEEIKLVNDILPFELVLKLVNNNTLTIRASSK